MSSLQANTTSVTNNSTSSLFEDGPLSTNLSFRIHPSQQVDPALQSGNANATSVSVLPAFKMLNNNFSEESDAFLRNFFNHAPANSGNDLSTNQENDLSPNTRTVSALAHSPTNKTSNAFFKDKSTNNTFRVILTRNNSPLENLSNTSPPLKNSSNRSPLNHGNYSPLNVSGATAPSLTQQLLRQATNQEEAHQIYNSVIARWKKLCILHPELAIYENTFSLCEDQEEPLEIFYIKKEQQASKEAVETRILGIGGISIMLEKMSLDLKTKIPCFICSEVETFKWILKKLLESSFSGKMTCVVNSLQFQAISSKRAPHVTPVLIEVEKGIVKFMIMDSNGTETAEQKLLPVGHSEYANYGLKASKNDKAYQTNPSMNLYRMINEAIPQEQNSCDFRIYVTAPRRQRDHSNCPIFTLHDIEHFLKNPNFFQEIEEGNEMRSEPLDPRLFYISNLPSEHMTLTQSLRQLGKYAAESSLKRANWDIQSVLNTCRVATPISPEDPKNTNAEDLTYLALDYICNCIESSDPKQGLENTKKLALKYQTGTVAPIFLKSYPKVVKETTSATLVSD